MSIILPKRDIGMIKSGGVTRPVVFCVVKFQSLFNVSQWSLKLGCHTTPLEPSHHIGGQGLARFIELEGLDLCHATGYLYEITGTSGELTRHAQA